MSEPAPAQGVPLAVMRSRQFVAILVLAAVVGVIASAATALRLARCSVTGSPIVTREPPKGGR